MKIKVRGRICYIGEHSDWASEIGLFPGRALASPINLGITAKVEKTDALCFIEDGQCFCVDNSDLESLMSNQINYYRYICSAAFLMREKFGISQNIGITVDSANLPVKAGLSSSAAISGLVVSGFDVAYGLNLSNSEKMELAYQAEKLTGSNCGRMDQLGILESGLYDIRFGDGISYTPVIVKGLWNFFIVVLGSEKKTVQILNELHTAYYAYERLREFLGPGQESLVVEAKSALESSDYKEFGLLLNDAQDQFDGIVQMAKIDVLTAPKFHELVEDEEFSKKILGSKEIGSHGDGSALVLCLDDAKRKECMNIVREKYGYKAFAFDVT